MIKHITWCAAFLLCACGSTEDCIKFDSLATYGKNAHSLKDSSPSVTAMRAMIREVNSCAFIDPDNKYKSELTFVSSKSYKNMTVLVFDVQSSSHLSIVFEFDESGAMVNRAYNPS